MAKVTVENKIEALNNVVTQLHHKLDIYGSEAKAILFIANALRYLEKGATRKFNNTIKEFEAYVAAKHSNA